MWQKLWTLKATQDNLSWTKRNGDLLRTWIIMIVQTLQSIISSPLFRLTFLNALMEYQSDQEACLQTPIFSFHWWSFCTFVIWQGTKILFFFTIYYSYRCYRHHQNHQCIQYTTMQEWLAHIRLAFETSLPRCDAFSLPFKQIRHSMLVIPAKLFLIFVIYFGG